MTGEMRAKRPGRVRLRLDATPAGARVLKRHKSLRTKVVVRCSRSARRRSSW
jgi:hypothetical protein